jgi:FtsP/CotA-like multicopper oxidase with cupredoxin domain
MTSPFQGGKEMFMPKKQKKEKKKTEITRREVLKMGAVTGGITLITSTKAFRTHFPGGSAYAQSIPPEPVSTCTQPANSPPTRPFLQALPIPPVATPVASLSPAPTKNANISGGEAPRAAHQRWNEFLPQVYYDVHTRPALHQFHPDIPPTYVWGFNGIVPGPTFISNYNTPILVRFHNELPVNHTGFGINEMTVHLHNGHTASESDGFAGDFYGPGFFKDHHYPNILAGYDEFPQTNGDPREAMGSLWYHDHRHSFTAPNSYRGLAGMYLLFDNRDTGNENDTRPSALRLPSGYGVYDIPIIIGSKLFCPDGQLFSNNPGAVPLGDKWVVNGAIQPYLQVKRRKYRFRFLNTGPALAWNLTMSDDRPFTVIATDANLLESPINVPTLPLNVAERYDVIFDFSDTAIGDKLYLLNDRPQFVNNGPEPHDLPPSVKLEDVVMRFDVVGDAPDSPPIPDVLAEYPPVDLNEVVGTRIWDFDLVNGQFLINGKVFDANRSDAQIQKGTAEKWILRNKLKKATWSHPVHIHFEEFRVLSRNGGPPPQLETGRKDVIIMPPLSEVELFMRFRNFTGKYMIHCHNMNHEDNFMLVRWDIVDNPPPQPISTFIPAKKGGVG